MRLPCRFNKKTFLMGIQNSRQEHDGTTATITIRKVYSKQRVFHNIGPEPSPMSASLAFSQVKRTERKGDQCLKQALLVSTLRSRLWLYFFYSSRVLCLFPFSFSSAFPFSTPGCRSKSMGRRVVVRVLQPAIQTGGAPMQPVLPGACLLVHHFHFVHASFSQPSNRPASLCCRKTTLDEARMGRDGAHENVVHTHT